VLAGGVLLVVACLIDSSLPQFVRLYMGVSGVSFVFISAVMLWLLNKDHPR
jgi:hypothetical protein